MNRSGIVHSARVGVSVGLGIALVTALVIAGRWGIAAAGNADLAMRLPWYVSRAAGVTAYALLSGSTLLGLLISTRALSRWLNRATVFALHAHLAWLGLAAIALHAGVLLLDTYQPFSLVELLLPFAAPYRPISVALGIVAMYLDLALVVSFYVKSWIGQRGWRLLHYSSFAVYVLATAHGVFAGSGATWMQWFYLVSGALTLLLVNYRLLYDRRAGGVTAHAATGPANAAQPGVMR